jgi:hypothetical protein
MLEFFGRPFTEGITPTATTTLMLGAERKSPETFDATVTTLAFFAAAPVNTVTGGGSAGTVNVNA